MKNQAQNQPVRAVDRRFSTTAYLGKAVFGAFASLGGGESSVYIETAEKARETAFIRLLEHAAAVGGNAVIGVQFTGQEIAEEMTEVMCYGTAVTLVPSQAPQKY
ncbi:hypothetical protein BG015_001011 [Linnemannia schmuckeri]|uniref:Uncharacterized protein n=1 Tax=Linnemannia schmuckeri TaxID=64567 RepID=A0A9P5RTW5_9FUNG|nr:hypothetical protein BG015_001011 [Linnemannia schmuckeri]